MLETTVPNKKRAHYSKAIHKGFRPLPQEGFTTQGCTKGHHATCFSLRCTCQCHRTQPKTVGRK